MLIVSDMVGPPASRAADRLSGPDSLFSTYSKAWARACLPCLASGASVYFRKNPNSGENGFRATPRAPAALEK
jgi:hypothetical protein